MLDLDGSEWFDIIICHLEDGVHTNLTPDTPYAIQPNLSWSPDGAQIAFIADQAGHFDTFILPSKGGEPRLVLGLPQSRLGRKMVASWGLVGGGHREPRTRFHHLPGAG